VYIEKKSSEPIGQFHSDLIGTNHPYKKEIFKFVQIKGHAGPLQREEKGENLKHAKMGTLRYLKIFSRTIRLEKLRFT
jgi:hypothetical protein